MACRVVVLFFRGEVERGIGGALAVGRGSRFLGRSADDDGLAVALSDAPSAKDLAPCLRCSKRCFGAGRYHPGLELGHRNHLQEKPSGGALDLRKISETNVYAGFKQTAEKARRFV